MRDTLSPSPSPSQALAQKGDFGNDVVRPGAFVVI